MLSRYYEDLEKFTPINSGDIQQHGKLTALDARI